MERIYFPICKLPQVSIEDTLAHQLDNGGPLTCRARRSTDGRHVVFAGMLMDPVPPYIFDANLPVVEQTDVLTWLDSEDDEHALWVTLPQLHELDAAELLGGLPDVQEP